MGTLRYYWETYKEELKFFSIPELTGAMQSFLVAKGLYADTLEVWYQCASKGQLAKEFAKVYNRDQDMNLLLSL